MSRHFIFIIACCFSCSYHAATAEYTGEMTGVSADEQLFFTTTRVETLPEGKLEGKIGTAFLISEEITPGTFAGFLVTCRHVLEGYDKARFTFIRDKEGKPELGTACSVIVGNLKNQVFFHPDPKIDVAVMAFAPVYNHFTANGGAPFIKTFGKENLPTEDQIKDISSIQSILFVGYPSGIRDEKNLIPVVRRGTTATPYRVNYNGLPLFLVDATVFPGSSGSPVVIFDQGSYSARDGNIAIGTRFHLLGLISMAYFRDEEGAVKFKDIPTALTPYVTQRNFLNLGVVVKANQIFETIDLFALKTGFRKSASPFPTPAPNTNSSPSPSSR